MYKGFLVSAVLAVPAIWFATSHALGGMEAPIAGTDFTGRDLFYCSLLGLVITGLIIWITEYYTGTNFRPVRSIAKASETRSEEHTSELQSLMRISYAVFCLKKKNHKKHTTLAKDDQTKIKHPRVTVHK